MDMEIDTTNVGGLVGENNGPISNSYSTGAITGRSNTVGGLAGSNVGTISNSYSTMEITSELNDIGGLVGTNDGEIIRSYSTGAITGDDWVGGLVGQNRNGQIIQSFSTGTVVGDIYVGGLAGANIYETSLVSNSYASGSATGENTGIGGLLGNIQSGQVINSYSIGFVTISHTIAGPVNVGGLVGGIDSGSVTNSYYDYETSGQSDDENKGMPLSTDDMQRLATFVNADWDFVDETANGYEDIWAIDDGIDYPYLAWQD